MKINTYTKKLLITYSVLGISAVLLSLLGLIWSNWLIIACVSVGVFFGFFNYYFLINSTNKLGGTNTTRTTAIFMAQYGGRFVLQALGLATSVLIIYFTRDVAATSTKVYFNILGTGIGYLLPAIVTAMVNPDASSKEKK